MNVPEFAEITYRRERSHIRAGDRAYSMRTVLATDLRRMVDPAMLLARVVENDHDGRGWHETGETLRLGMHLIRRGRAVDRDPHRVPAPPEGRPGRTADPGLRGHARRERRAGRGHHGRVHRERRPRVVHRDQRRERRWSAPRDDDARPDVAGSGRALSQTTTPKEPDHER